MQRWKERAWCFRCVLPASKSIEQEFSTERQLSTAKTAEHLFLKLPGHDFKSKFNR